MSTTATEHEPPSRLLALPSELRDIIYEHLFEPSGLSYPNLFHDGYSHYDFSPYAALQRTSRLIASESKRIFYNLNRFVRIRTPWPEAQHHIEHEGRVPMVSTADRAQSFKDWSVDVVIDAPELHGLGVEAMDGDFSFHKFVIHSQDLEAFTRMWFYSDLSHPGLNGHLRLILVLRDPFPTMDEETSEMRNRPMSKQLQNQIMLPFGCVKGLLGVEVDGKHDHNIFQAMKAEMDVPYISPEECLERASKKKEEAETTVAQKKDYSRAVRLYCDAFKEIHIPCHGRIRNIYGDAWFVKTLDGGRYDGQQGHLVRLVLRVQLVASVVECFLELEEWEEARYWGMRSVTLMREASGEEDGEGEDEPMLGFPGADAVGLLYYRTAKACRMLGDRNEARKLIKVAIAYLPGNEEIRMEWKELQLIRVGGYGSIDMGQRNLE